MPSVTEPTTFPYTSANTALFRSSFLNPASPTTHSNINQHASISCLYYTVLRRLRAGHPSHRCVRPFSSLTRPCADIFPGAPVDTALEAVKRDAAPLAESDLEKRQLDLDLSSVTDAVGDLVNTLTGLLPGVLSTVTSLDATINQLLGNVEADLDGTLDSVKSELQSTIDQLNAIIKDQNLEGTLDTLSEDLTSTITEVQTLLADVQALAGKVDANALLSEVEGLVNELLTLLTNLLGSLKH